MSRLVGGGSRFVTPARKEDLRWYQNNPWVIGAILIVGLIGIVLVVYFR